MNNKVDMRKAHLKEEGSVDFAMYFLKSMRATAASGVLDRRAVLENVSNGKIEVC